MGVHLMLDVFPEQIDTNTWNNVYDTTLRLLTSHPAGLLAHRVISACEMRIACFSRSLELPSPEDLSDPTLDLREKQRHWCVAGDATSLRTGEPFELFRDLERYRSTARAGWPASHGHPDILRYLADETFDKTPLFGLEHPSRPERLWAGDTRGAPYHIALVAAGMIVEARCPGKALLSGDINRSQGEAAQALIAEVLGEAVPLPLRVDADRLRARLATLVTQEMLEHRFRAIHVGETRRSSPSAEAILAPLGPRSGPLEDLEDVAIAARTADLSEQRRDEVRCVATAVRNARDDAFSQDGEEAFSVARGNLPLLRHWIAQLLVRGPLLTEDAWRQLDKEQDEDLLSFCLVLAAIPPSTWDNDTDAAASAHPPQTASLPDSRPPKTGEIFSSVRRALLQNRPLCAEVMR